MRHLYRIIGCGGINVGHFVLSEFFTGLAASGNHQVRPVRMLSLVAGSLSKTAYPQTSATCSRSQHA